MTTSTKSSVLKDVVAYVDVWSSDKMANYAKPFVQQLQEMGAQVSKTFNKQVTHVVFYNGHSATWRKAQKSDVRLVSVLWVGRCYEDGVCVDEELFPAFNDETNPALKNKRHRCMQPKDSPDKTPENDRRMRRKLDKMMKDVAIKQPIVTDVSPIIIDEENGIIYSPAMKRSDYMAKRLKDMKEKRENLSPTASQSAACSPSAVKPSLGSTPTILRLTYDMSDDDSSASAAEPAYSPDKEEERAPVDIIDCDHLKQSLRKGSNKPCPSPCKAVPKQTSRTANPIKSDDFEDSKKTRQSYSHHPKKTSRRTSVRTAANKYDAMPSLDSPCEDRRSDTSKELQREKSQSDMISNGPLPDQTEKGTKKAAKSFTETKTHSCHGAAYSSSSFSSPATLGTAAIELSKETGTALQKKIPKRAKLSLSALVRSFTSDCKSVGSAATDGDDDVFEDYFSPANHKSASKRPSLPDLPMETDIPIPFNLDPVPKKKNLRRSECIGSEIKSKKKRTLQSDATSEAQCHPNQDVKVSVPELDSQSHDVTPVAKRRRQSTLPFTSTHLTPSDTGKRRRRSVQPTMSAEANTVSKLQENSPTVLSPTLESRGNVHTVAAGLTESLPEGDEEENPNKQVSLSLESMVNKTKAMRTLVMTSMPTEKQHTLVQVVTSLGGFSIVDQVCESTTHVVSGSHRRTLNILLGIARGCWILSFEWILWCLEKTQWIPEEPYELSEQFPAAQVRPFGRSRNRVSGFGSSPSQAAERCSCRARSGSDIVSWPQRCLLSPDQGRNLKLICRLQRHLSAGEHQQDLFHNQPAMFVSQHSQPPTPSLQELIQLCGGTVCKSVRQAGFCIGSYSGRRPQGTRMLSEQWVLDSITQLKLLSCDDYDLESKL